MTPAVFFWCFFFVALLGINQFLRVGLTFVCWFYDGHTQRLTKNGYMEKQRIEPASPGLQGLGLSPTPQRLLFWCFFFVVFCCIIKFCWVGFRYVCWLRDWNTKRLTKSCFMEKPGIAPVTPGLQRIALFHYTTVAVFWCFKKKLFCGSPGYLPVPPGWFKISVLV